MTRELSKIQFLRAFGLPIGMSPSQREDGVFVIGFENFVIEVSEDDLYIAPILEKIPHD